MSNLFPLPDELARVDYAQLYFHLEVVDPFDLPPLGLLQLRRELLLALQSLRQEGDVEAVALLRAILEPPLPVDPRLRRLVQKPTSALILQPDGQLQGMIDANQRLVLPVLFIGASRDHLDNFCLLLRRLGELGLYNGRGRFLLDGVEAEDASGLRSMLWVKGAAERPLVAPQCDLLWWLERQPALGDELELEWLTPLRLLRQGKPLFRANFTEIFPFVLRRVSALLAAHGGVELIADPAGLLQAGGQVEVLDNRLRWNDWRRLEGEQGGQNLGGLLGSLRLAGPALADLHWLLQLGSLFQVGKGAPWGAGRYRLRTSQ